ncbi:hypothetical protein FNV43_RR02626 [Rhamnella rubrinervis]|uniref:Uncharacterized protein n=1 Tax=Rhamnella rubrinervis TaxID=2594499 RepID=A0A8K0HTW3_9ROSA|nr:hypothetical protein FNV43_RR02626 [Rhamnella rubrinervis]
MPMPVSCPYWVLVPVYRGVCTGASSHHLPVLVPRTGAEAAMPCRHRCLSLGVSEVSSGLRSRIEFAKNQPEANRNYKNLLLPGKIAFYFSRETLFNGVPFINHMGKTLHSGALKEIETLPMDMYASSLAALGAKATLSEFEKKAMLMDNEVKLNEETIQKLQDSLSKSKARIKELESDVIESKEKSTRALRGSSLKSLRRDH